MDNKVTQDQPSRPRRSDIAGGTMFLLSRDFIF